MTSRYGGYEDQEPLAGLYDIVYTTAVRRYQDVEFFIDYSKRVRGKTLELGCGTGRVLIPTAIAGCEITGLDISRHMLGKCREKLAKQPQEVQQRVRLIQGNMTDFKTGEVYSLITTPFRPFQHLISVEEQVACLTCANRHLVPDGLLILDLFHTSPPRLYDVKYMMELEDIPETSLPDGRKIRRTSRIAAFHRNEQCNDIEMLYYVSHPDGRVERLVQSFPFRYFFRYEVEHLLSLCGFKVVELLGNYDRSEFANDSAEMIFVAGKK